MQVEVTAAALKMIATHAAGKAVAKWEIKVVAAVWHSIMDVKATFASVSPVTVDSGRVALVFNVQGSLRLITIVSYPAQVVVVHYLLTHADYDKNQWKGQL